MTQSFSPSRMRWAQTLGAGEGESRFLQVVLRPLHEHSD